VYIDAQGFGSIFCLDSTTKT